MQHWVQSEKSENVTTTEYKYFQIEISRIFAKVAKVMQTFFFFLYTDSIAANSAALARACGQKKNFKAT